MVDARAVRVLRRVSLLASVFAAYAAPAAWAQDTYPSRLIHIIAPTAPGGGSTVSARLIAEAMSKRAGRQIAVVENRPGAATRIGTELVAKAKPDGYTLLMAPGALATNPAGFKNLPYDAVRDFAPITQALAVPNLIVVHPSLGVTSLNGFIALAKARPGEILFASAGHATQPHLTMALFMNMAGIRMVHVPYQGGAPGITALLVGEVALTASSSMSVLIPHVRTGRLRALAVTGAQRSAVLPDVPTVAESGLAGYESIQWSGLLAPARTPRDIIDKLHREVVSILHAPEVKERLAKLDNEVATSTSPEAFGTFIESEIAKWTKVAKAAGITPE
ncbi:MAG: tripartite tricarboxylate transporter substrate binding protein [Burkholderiales bacterium]